MEQEINEIVKNCSGKMSKTIESLIKDFTKVRTGQANPAILENVRIEYYGAQTPINQLGNISVADQLITITAWEKKLLPDIERAILKANLGLNPQNDGNLIRIQIQPLTEERRKEMVKLITKMAELHKTSIRGLRRDANNEIKQLKDNKNLSEDMSVLGSNQIQKLTDDYIAQIEQHSKDKEKELLLD